MNGAEWFEYCFYMSLLMGKMIFVPLVVGYMVWSLRKLSNISKLLRDK